VCCLPPLPYRSCLVTMHECRRSGSLRAGALPLLGSDIRHLVFLPVPYSLIAEAADSVASASADAFSSASSAWFMVAPAACAASLALRPKVATMHACNTSGGSAPSCYVAILCMAASSTARCRFAFLVALCSNISVSSSSVEGRTLCLVRCYVISFT